MASVTAVVTERRTEKLDLRVSRAAKAKLQAAAAASHRSMSDFVMESALARAEETLVERRTFGPQRRKPGQPFQAALNAPVRAFARIACAPLREPGFFDPACRSAREAAISLSESRMIEKLRRDHPLEAFDCGQPDMNRWLIKYALQNQGSNAAQTYLGIVDGVVVGYHSLAAGRVEYADAPDRLQKRVGEPSGSNHAACPTGGA